MNVYFRVIRGSGERETRRKFIISYISFFISPVSGVLVRIPFSLSNIHHRNVLKALMGGVSYDRFRVQPWKVYHVFYSQEVWKKKAEIICKNRFNFKFIFLSLHPSSPCVLYWFWYYRYHSSDDDVFSPPSPVFLLPPFVCLAKQKYFIIKTKLTAFFMLCKKHIFCFLLFAKNVWMLFDDARALCNKKTRTNGFKRNEHSLLPWEKNLQTFLDTNKKNESKFQAQINKILENLAFFPNRWLNLCIFFAFSFQHCIE